MLNSALLGADCPSCRVMQRDIMQKSPAHAYTQHWADVASCLNLLDRQTRNVALGASFIIIL